MSSSQFKSDIKRVKEASINNKLVVFVGAGLSQNSGLPGWELLIEELKVELHGSVGNEKDYLKIAQLYYNSREKKEYLDKIRSIFNVGAFSKNPIHDLIFDLKPCHVVTTNYDNLLEQTISERNLQYYTIKKDSDLPYSTYDRFLIKMHGDLDEGNIILTEEDYYNYSNNFPLIETFVKSLFASKLILFIGFSFDDLNLKIITNKVKNILKDDFQPMYLLNVSTETTYLYYEYYKNLGIRIVDYNEIIERNIFIGDKLSYNLIHEEKGKQLFKFLLYIKQYEPIREKAKDNKWNIIDIIYQVYLELKDELKVIDVKYLSQIYPFNEISIEDGFISPRVIELRDNLKGNFHNKREFLKKFGKKYDELRFIANINRINYVDKTNLYSKVKLKLISRKTDIDLNRFFELDIEAINKRIEALYSKPIYNISIENLELPYLLCKTERYYDAYIKLKEFAKISWNKQKYIVYLICSFNIKALRNKLIYNHEFIREIDDIDLNHIVETIQVKYLPIKKFFKDIIENKYILYLLNEENELKNEILDSKNLADGNGFSFNDNISKLSNNIWNNWNIINSNYLFLEDFNNYRKTYQIAFEGFLISNSTKGKSTKLSHLYSYQLLIGIFYLDTKSVKRIISDYNIKSIAVSLDSKEYLKILSDNLVKILSSFFNNREYVILQQYRKAFRNLIVLLAYIEDCQDILKDLVNKLFHFILTDDNSRDSIIFDLLSDISFSELVDSQYLELVLYEMINHYYGKGTEDFIKNVIKTLGRSNPSFKISNNETIKRIIDISFQDDWLAKHIIYFYPILGDADKNEVTKKCEEYLLNKFQLITCSFFLSNEIYFDNELLLNKLVGEFEITYLAKKSIFPFYEFNVILALYQVFKKTNHLSIKESIQKLADRSPFLDFLIEPLAFNKFELFSTSWLYYLDPDLLKEISGISEIRLIIQKELNDKCANQKFLLDVYFKYFNGKN